MGPQHKNPDTEQVETSQFTGVNDAYDQIQPFLTAQFEYRETGINQICNQLNQADAQGLGMSVLKTGLKLGLAAAAGAVGAATGGLGWVALGAIGLGFGVGGEIVDAIFSDPAAPAGVEEFRTKRLNVLTNMKARETSKLKENLKAKTAPEWERAYADYQAMQTNAALQATEMNSTLDGWMNALNARENGTGGDIGEGSEVGTDMTTGRLFLTGTVGRQGSVRVGINSANIDGLDNASLRNSYLDRSISDIGMFVDFAFYMNGDYGALQFNAGQDYIGMDGGDRWKSGLGYLTVDGPTIHSPDHDWGADWADGARLVKAVLNDYTLRQFGIREVSTPSLN
jgi:hypothetical protein